MSLFPSAIESCKYAPFMSKEKWDHKRNRAAIGRLFVQATCQSLGRDESIFADRGRRL